MKKYLILTFDVCNMGGGQLFVLRRAKHLKEKGFDVYIVVTFHNNYFPLEHEFKGIPIYVIPEMGAPSVKICNKRVNTIISNLIDRIGEGGELYIESHTLPTIEWGDLIAKEYGGRHLAYPLAEPMISQYRFNPGLRIFEHKLCNGEFYGCNSTSLREIFGKSIEANHYVNIGYDEKELYEDSYPTIDYCRDSNDYVISTVTRLDKTYVEPLVLSTANLAKKYSDTRFVLLIAGGSKTPGREDYLFSNFNNEKMNVPNLNIIYTGYIEKLGRDFFNMTDVFVGMGTASITAISQKCITINIDPLNNMKYASGIFGVDTNNFAYSENGIKYSILEKLEEVFNLNDEKKNTIKQIGRKLYCEEFETNTCFEKLDKIITGLPKVIDADYTHISGAYRFFVISATVLKRLYQSIKRH